MPGFGARSLELRTTGATSDEGWFSSPVVAKAGQTWVHTVWLEGAHGGEQVNVSIWEYNDREQAIYRAELPVVLTARPEQYAVKTTITDPEVTHIRVLVRTTRSGEGRPLRRSCHAAPDHEPCGRQTGEITTYNSDGAILSPDDPRR